MMQQWRRAWSPWDVHHLPTQPAQHSTRHCWGWGLKRSLWQPWAAGSRKGKLLVPVLASTLPGATCPHLEVLSPAVGGRKYNRLCQGTAGCFSTGWCCPVCTTLTLIHQQVRKLRLELDTRLRSEP